MRITERLAQRLFGSYIEQRVQNAVKVVDDRWWKQIGGATGPHDRQWGDFTSNLEDSLTAWRDNPLARRIVALTTDYVVGDGMHVTSESAQATIDAFWNHDMNNIGQRLYRWSDELTRSGELFLVLHRNPADGMSYVRSIPASKIDQIETSPDDLEDERAYHELIDGSLEGRWWQGRHALGTGQPVMLHYAINRPVGAVRGEGDLTAILDWLRRYKEWLEDRVRVNRLRNSFLWQVRLTNAQPGDVERKRAQYKQPPSPGSVIVSDSNEEWVALSASLQSSDAEADGKALRLMIAAGAGIPLHFLSEGESATKATASEMGGPTFRHYKHRQLWFADMLKDLVGCVLVNARQTVPDDLAVELPDLSREDNLQLAQAMTEVGNALSVFVEHGWLSEDEAGVMALRIAGEV